MMVHYLLLCFMLSLLILRQCHPHDSLWSIVMFETIAVDFTIMSPLEVDVSVLKCPVTVHLYFKVCMLLHTVLKCINIVFIIIFFYIWLIIDCYYLDCRNTICLDSPFLNMFLNTSTCVLSLLLIITFDCLVIIIIIDDGNVDGHSRCFENVIFFLWKEKKIEWKWLLFSAYEHSTLPRLILQLC